MRKNKKAIKLIKDRIYELEHKHNFGGDGIGLIEGTENDIAKNKRFMENGKKQLIEFKIELKELKSSLKLLKEKI